MSPASCLDDRDYMLQSQAVFDPKQSFCSGCDSFWILLQATEGLQGRRMWHVAQLHGSQRGTRPDHRAAADGAIQHC